jgi:hypothetical protein
MHENSGTMGVQENKVFARQALTVASTAIVPLSCKYNGSFLRALTMTTTDACS